MSNISIKQSGFSVTFLQLLTLVFVVLKLTHFVNWSWWWVLVPLWGPIALVLGILGVILIFLVIASLGIAVAKLFGA